MVKVIPKVQNKNLGLGRIGINKVTIKVLERILENQVIQVDVVFMVYNFEVVKVNVYVIMKNWSRNQINKVQKEKIVSFT